jgi:hypothetical protein
MKKISLFAVMIIALSMTGCASNGFLMAKPKVLEYGQTCPAKNVDAELEVFRTIRPTQDFVEIAEITRGDTDDSWNLEQIKIKAREVGADAIIITGKSGSHCAGLPIGDMSYVVTEAYGISAIAIKYK